MQDEKENERLVVEKRDAIPTSEKGSTVEQKGRERNFRCPEQRRSARAM